MRFRPFSVARAALAGRREITPLVLNLAAAAVLTVPAFAQNAASSAAATNAGAAAEKGWDPQQILRTERFVKPPANVERMIMTPRIDISFTDPSPDRNWFLRATGTDRGDIDAYGKPHIYLGGLAGRHEGATARARVTTSTRTGIALVNPRTGATKTVETPKGAIDLGADLVAQRHADRLHRQLRRCVARLRRRCRERQVDAAQQDAAARDARHQHRLDGRRQEHRRGARARRSRCGADPWAEAASRTDRRCASPRGRAVPQPVHPSLLAGSARQGAAQVLHDRAARAHRREVESRAQDRRAGDDPRGRCVARRTVLPRHAHDRAVLVLVPVSTVRLRAGAVGRDGQGRSRRSHHTPLREGAADDGDAAPAGRGGASASPSDTGKRNIQWNPVGPGLVYLQSVFAAAPAGGAPAVAVRVGAVAEPVVAAAAARQRVRSRRACSYVSWLPPFGANDTKVLYEGGPQLANVAYSADGKTMFVSRQRRGHRDPRGGQVAGSTASAAA